MIYFEQCYVYSFNYRGNDYCFATHLHHITAMDNNSIVIRYVGNINNGFGINFLC